MNKLLLVLLVWLSACASIPYATVPPARYYAAGNTWAFNKPGQPPAYHLSPGVVVQVVGTYGDWYVVRNSQGRHFVGANALNRDTGTPFIFSDTPIYPPGYRAAIGDIYLDNGYAAPVPDGLTHDVYAGPRGGHYYYNGNGNKTYVTPQSTIDRQDVQTGPRGGRYYINSHGNKTYIKH